MSTWTSVSFQHRLPIVCDLVPHARTATTTTTLSRGHDRVRYYYSSRATTTDHDEHQIQRQQQQPTRGQSTILLRGSRLGKSTNTHPYQPTTSTTSTSTSGITNKSQGCLKIEALLRFTRSSEDIHLWLLSRHMQFSQYNNHTNCTN